MPDIFNIVSIGGVRTTDTTASIVRLINQYGGYPCLHSAKIALEQGQFVLPANKDRIVGGIKNGAYVAAITICHSNLKNRIQGFQPKKVYYTKSYNDYIESISGGSLVNGLAELTASQQFFTSGGPLTDGQADMYYGSYLDSGTDGAIAGGQGIDDYVEHTFTPMFDGSFFLEHSSPSGLPSSNNARSMFAWVRVPNDYTVPQSIFGYGGGGGDVNEILFEAQGGATLGFFDTNLYAPYRLEPNTWVLVGIAYDGSNMRLHIWDDSSHIWNLNPFFNTDLGKVRVALGIGSEDLDTVDDLFVGDVLSMGIWNRKLSDGEVNDMYTAGRTTYADLPSNLKTVSSTNVTNAQARTLHLTNLTARSILIGNLQSNISMTLDDIRTSTSSIIEALTQVSLDDMELSGSRTLEIIKPTIDYIRTSTGAILEFGTIETSDAGLISFWNLTEGSGTRHDSVGSNHLNKLSESASFTYTTPVGRGNSTTFTDTSILATSWHWNFGDETSSIDQNPTHTYNSDGIFFVTLTINHGAQFDSREIVVEEPSPSFTDNSPQTLGTPIVFTDTSTFSVSWLWDFGDGSGTSTEQNPTYTYSAPGTYTVSMQLNGDISNTSASVTVNALPSEIWYNVDLSPYYNIIGIVATGYDYSSPGTGYGLDGGSPGSGGNTMSGNIIGPSPDTINSVDFIIPQSGDNITNNVISCTGQTILISGARFQKLYLLGFGTNGSRTVSFIVNYSDSSRDTISQQMSDWFSGTTNSFSHEEIAITESNRLASNGSVDSGPVYIYKYTLTIDSSKNAVSITLPNSEFAFIISITEASSISNPACWIKADDFIANDGDAITNWHDRSGNAHNFLQSSSGAQPIYRTNIINGLPAILFNGSSTFMHSTISAPNKYSVFAVYKQLVSGNFAVAVSWGTGTTGKTFWTGYIPNSSETSYPGHLIPASDSSQDNYSAAVDDTTWHITRGSFDGTNLTGSDFGVSATPSAIQVSGILSSSNATIGAYGATPSLFWTGHIAEVFFFNSELSDGDVDLVMSYLIHKYDLVARDEIQTISFSDTPTSGTFTITVNGITTSNIPYYSTAGDVQNYINSALNSGDTHVT